ncbi:ATP-binding protein [Thalassospira sp.]|uniref:ATP-binding protein n=1 Tax=Thalassospira sp. TaxID=1912094 RepID=UPI001B027248|nr:ATP-binding protein [Thalassospira sp.]MBO6808387.1 ATP-binding protein [Thalassospira sp.]MBO6839915.1 ATP-binding protein [Thalassospira sp.]
MTDEHFRISSHLKDIIGRDLVTNEFVAVFELVKNSFDAHAQNVEICFDLERDHVWLVDDGKGMDRHTIKDRWLFVAYSAKADGTEDSQNTQGYRNKIRPAGQYAGSKGIGRFSCDTLGSSLRMYTRSAEETGVNLLDISWESFEENNRDLFNKIGVSLESTESFPDTSLVRTPSSSGTMLQISDLRGKWDLERISSLRSYLGKLIDPFGTTEDIPVSIRVNDPSLTDEQLAKIEGPIANEIRDLLDQKTTRIKVSIDRDTILSELVDRGRVIYKISEKNIYEGLRSASVNAEIYYLNKSAKDTFTRRMGVRPVEFGSIFLFLNGFRIFPVGEETDDTFGLNRRKQQGSSRYFGTRDVMGRVDVTAETRVFREASSRDSGLIEDANTRDLYEAIRRKAIIRLERYVVGITWKDKPDAMREDASGLEQLSTRNRVVSLIGQLAASSDIELQYYDEEAIDVFEQDARSTQNSLNSLVTIAEAQGDEYLLRRVEETRARIRELEESELEAAKAAQRAVEERARADERIARLEQQARYLASTQDMTVEQMTLLLHQVLIYAGHIGSAVDRALKLTHCDDRGGEARDIHSPLKRMASQTGCHEKACQCGVWRQTLLRGAQSENHSNLCKALFLPCQRLREQEPSL